MLRARDPWLLASLALAVLTALLVSFAPTTSWESSDGGSGTSSFADEDRAVLALLLAPAVLIGMVLLLAPTAAGRAAVVAAAVLLFLFCALGAASVGLFFLPVALLTAIAAARGPRRPAGLDSGA